MMLGAQLSTIARQIELSHGMTKLTVQPKIALTRQLFGSVLLAMGEKVNTLGCFKTKANSWWWRSRVEKWLLGVDVTIYHDQQSDCQHISITIVPLGVEKIKIFAQVSSRSITRKQQFRTLFVLQFSVLEQINDA
jgi:hypothetical protein